MKTFELFEDKYKFHNLQNAKEPGARSVKDPKEMAAIIEKNCKTMLSAFRTSGKYLYRGIKSNDDAIITSIRPDRRPVEMDPLSHENLHLAFKKAGLKATRKNSIFCSASHIIAISWGDPYVIFVKDGWSGTIFETKKKDYTFYKMQEIGTHETVDDMTKDILKMKPKAFSSSADLAKILSAKYEDILITGDSYLAFESDSETWETVRELLKLP